MKYIAPAFFIIISITSVFGSAYILNAVWGVGRVADALPLAFTLLVLAALCVYGAFASWQMK